MTLYGILTMEEKRFTSSGIVLCNDLTVGIGLAVKTRTEGFVKMRRTSGMQVVLKILFLRYIS